MRCKQCGREHTNGTNFCTRKCRLQWIRDHNIKGAKKRHAQAVERELMSWGSSFSNED